MGKWKKAEYKELVYVNREEVEEARKKQTEDYFVQTQEKKREEEKLIEEQRKEEYRKLSLFYREKNLEKRIKKQQVHKVICGEIMNFILDLSDVFSNLKNLK